MIAYPQMNLQRLYCHGEVIGGSTITNNLSTKFWLVFRQSNDPVALSNKKNQIPVDTKQVFGKYTTTKVVVKAGLKENENI